MTAQEPIIRYEVPGARRFGNYVWGSLMCLGGLGFLVTGISSYFEFPFLSLLKSPIFTCMISGSFCSNL